MAAPYSRNDNVVAVIKNATLQKKLLALCLFAAFLWAAFWPFDVLVRGMGIIRVEGHNIQIQHAEGGVLKQLLVTTGENVKAGQALATVENLTIAEDNESNLIAVRAFELRENRLRAELDGKDFNPPPPANPKLAEIYRNETDLYNARRRALNESIAIAKTQFEQKEAQLTSNNVAIENLGAEMQLSNEHIKLLEPLVARGAAAEATLVQRRLEYQKVLSALADARSKIPGMTSARDEARLKMSMYRTEFVEDANKQLAEVQVKLETARAQWEASQKRALNSEVTSPVDGVIQQVVMPHVGAVLRPGEKLFEIAPSKVPLVADVKVVPQDRDRLWVGQDVRVRVMAISNYSSPTLKGKVAVISADAVGDDEKGRYYEVTVNMDAQPDNMKIFPGMTVETFALAGQRTFLQYLFKPFVDGMSIVFSE
ncbi:HlyD family type I secretion periplasmic adaptor subunit [Bartonella sp. LJL80]